MVVADSQHRARTAAEAVAVEYEVLEPVVSPDAALSPDAPSIHPDGNLLEVCAFSRGDVEAALAESAHVVEETFSTQRIEHAFLEPEASLAVPTDGGLKIYSQGQGVHDDQLQIAAILGIQREKVEVELVSNGGAFGGKEDLSVQGQGIATGQIENLLDLRLEFAAAGNLTATFTGRSDTLIYDGIFSGELEGYRLKEVSGRAIITATVSPGGGTCTWSSRLP